MSLHSRSTLAPLSLADVLVEGEARAAGCLRAECLVASTVGLTHAQLRETQRWVELYEFHDKYRLVGVVADNPVEDVVARAMLEHAAMQVHPAAPLP
jgi:hypothetical protein